MADKFLRVGGRSDNGLAKPIRTDEDGRVEIARRKTEQVLLFDKLTITSTATVFSEDINVSGGKYFTLYVMNDHNLPVFLEMQLRPDGLNRHTDSTRTLDMEDYKIEVPSRYIHRGYNIVTEDQYPVLKASLNTVRIGVSTDEIPSQGNLTAILSYTRGG